MTTSAVNERAALLPNHRSTSTGTVMKTDPRSQVDDGPSASYGSQGSPNSTTQSKVSAFPPGEDDVTRIQGKRRSDPGFCLHTGASQLVASLKLFGAQKRSQSRTQSYDGLRAGPTNLDSDAEGSRHGDSELSVYLYAISALRTRQLVHSSTVEVTTAGGRTPESGTDRRARPQTSLRTRLADDETDRKVREAIYDLAESLLDRFTELEQDLGVEEEDERLHRVFRSRWKISEGSDKWVNAIDLLLPPFASRAHPSPFLSHPVVRHILNHAWSHGSSSAFDDDRGMSARSSSTLGRLIREIERQATPSRLHALDLFSFLVFYGLTLSVALSPGGLITPYGTPDDSGKRWASITPKEILWIIWAGSNLIASTQPLPLIQRLLLLPTHLAFILLPFSTLQDTIYLLINLSIPTFTFLLILPIPPSLPIALNHLLPLSVLLRRILSRSIRTAGLLMPLVLVLFIIFGWSMNGDIFRGFFAFPTDIYPVLPSASPVLYTPTPIEEGISPFPARVSLFLTLSLLFLFSCILTAARSMVAPRDTWDDENARRWRGAVREGDTWEKDGLVLGREARQAWAESVRRYTWEVWDDSKSQTVGSAQSFGDDGGLETPNADRGESAPTTSSSPSNARNRPHTMRTPIAPSLPPPINLITIPFDLLSLIPSTGSWRKKLLKWRHHLHVILAGFACLPLMLFATVVGEDRYFSES